MKNKIYHIAIIMDGNRRWAEKRGKPKIIGHKYGVLSLKKIINFAINYKLNILTLYAFSIENWSRPFLEVIGLMRLFIFSIKNVMYELHEKNVCVNIIGNKDKLPKKLVFYIKKIEFLTKNNKGLKLNIAINYSGKWDFICCVKKISYQVKNKLININQINENIVNQNLCLNHLPDIDLLIRTGGEKRISNFFLWKIAYTELFFTNILWPDFSCNDFLKILNDFLKRKRRFGGNISL